MANLIMPDTFEPYYAGRDDKAERTAEPGRETKQPVRQADGEIVLPEEAPAPEGITRRSRRPVAH